MDNRYWNDSIKRTIEKCAYNFYVVHPIRNVQCPCVDHSTQQADPNCKMCLGMGTKIKIKKVRGACNDIRESATGKSVRGSAAITVGKTYFIDIKYPISDIDMIIDGKEACYVFRVYTMKGLTGEVTHNEITALPIRNDHDLTVKNFYNLMKKYGGKK